MNEQIRVPQVRLVRDGEQVGVVTIEEAMGIADEAGLDLVERVAASLKEADSSRRSIILAALAELSVRYMQDPPPGQQSWKGRAAS